MIKIRRNGYVIFLNGLFSTIFVQLLNLHIFAHLPSQRCINIYTQTHMCMHIHTHTHTCIHKYLIYMLTYANFFFHFSFVQLKCLSFLFVKLFQNIYSSVHACVCACVCVYKCSLVCLVRMTQICCISTYNITDNMSNNNNNNNNIDLIQHAVGSRGRYKID